VPTVVEVAARSGVSTRSVDRSAPTPRRCSLIASVLVLLTWALAAFAGSVLVVKRQRLSRPAPQPSTYAESVV